VPFVRVPETPSYIHHIAKTIRRLSRVSTGFQAKRLRRHLIVRKLFFTKAQQMPGAMEKHKSQKTTIINSEGDYEYEQAKLTRYCAMQCYRTNTIFLYAVIENNP
jgi:hypothetical protein